MLIGVEMDTKDESRRYRHAFHVQRRGAFARGIEWDLTYEQWRNWWGCDIQQRGQGKGMLMMMRFHDKGPYAIGNISKGTALDNSRTASNVRKSVVCVRDAQELQRRQDALMEFESVLDEREHDEIAFGYPRKSSFCP